MTDIQGTFASDTLNGSESADTIDAGGGDDIVNGLGGDDSLDGQDGNDLLYGGADDDTLHGGEGHDILRGEGGADALSGEAGDDFLVGGAGDDVLDGGDGDDRVSLFDDTGAFGVTVDLRLDGVAQNFGSFGSDSLIGIEHVTTTYGDDTVDGNERANWIWSFSGIDALSGHEGDDLFTVGRDAKIVDGGSGSDTVEIYDLAYEPAYGSSGITVSLGLQGQVQHIGTGDWTLTGIENLSGWYGNDHLTGDDNANTLAGGAGADTLNGGGGDDWLLGDGAVAVGYSADNPGAFAFFSSADEIGFEDWGGGPDILSGGEGNDRIDGGVGNDRLEGGSGNDILDGGSGGDLMIGGAGDDVYFVDHAWDGQAADGVIEQANEGVDEIRTTIDWGLMGIADVENLTAIGTANISLSGNDGANLLTGNSGDNYIVGASGNDGIDGGAGRDTASFQLAPGTTGSVRQVVGTGADEGVILIQLVNGTTVQTWARVTVTGQGTATVEGVGIGAFLGTDTVSNVEDLHFFIANTQDFATQFTNVLLASVQYGEFVAGSASGDVIDVAEFPGAVDANGNGGDDIVTGTDADNYLAGGAGADILHGGGGEDVLEGGADDDTLHGGEGHDTLRGQAANDALFGGGGDDFLVGGGGNDVLVGGEGLDRISLFDETGSFGVTVDLRLEGIDQDFGAFGTDTLLGIEHVNTTYGDDTVDGNERANWIWTYSGFDTLSGHEGDDLFTVGRDTKVIDGGSGSDTVEILDLAYAPAYKSSGITVSLALQGQAQATGTGEWTLTGIENLSGWYGNDHLTGDEGANILAGAEGSDTLDGGDGDDWLIGDGAVVVGYSEENPAAFGFFADLADLGFDGLVEGRDVLSGGAGNDRLEGGGGDDILNGGTGDDDLQGGADGDALRGNEGEDVLSGGGGDDFLVGGTGNDRIEGGDGNDRASIFYDSDGGAVSIDLRQEGIAQNAGAAGFDSFVGIEHITATYGDDTLTGNDAGNWFWTFNGTDILAGNGGDDLFTVGLGQKVIDGGAGSDTVEILDLAYEPLYTAAGVSVSLALQGAAQATGVGDWTLSDIENLAGSWGADRLTGDGDANVLLGAEGADTLVGGDGDDVLSGDGTTTLGGGPDSGAITLLLNPDFADYAYGNDTLQGGAGNDILIGGAGGDILDGGSGVDTMTGGAGNDTYRVDNALDQMIEGAGGGADTVEASLTWTLADLFENLTLLGSAAINGSGNGAANVLTGNSAANVLNGMAGIDTMAGGAGNDTYVVDEALDRTIETAGGGVDTVQSLLTWTLGAELDNLTLLGTAAINGTGNGLANVLAGNGAANVLNGMAAADTMTGGGGNDTYVVDDALDRTIESAAGGTDTVQSSVTWTLSAELENLTLLGTAAINGTGNGGANAITGNTAANVLNGMVGADTMTGAAGNDTYVVDNLGDRAIESAGGGTDTVQASLTWTLGAELENLTLLGSAAINGTGNTLANLLTGNSGANVLNGMTGADTMTGAGGNDTYVVDNLGDRAIEVGGGGTDTVQSILTWTLGAELENLTLLGTAAVNGTGNTLANALIGNAAANVLNGMAGADTMTGGAGNDTYVVDNALDRTIESAGGGVDTVQSILAWTLGAELDNLTLLGTAAINGTGNTLANLLTGNAAANVLNGMAGADTMTGGAGNDTYVVDNALDRTLEAAGGGIDTVQSVLTWTLGAEVENLTLLGTGAINGTGNALANVLTGNAAANVLNGMAGADTMTGGAGNDSYFIDNLSDRIVELSGGGMDSVESSVSHVLAVQVENLVLSGASAINGTGNASNNSLSGNTAANVLSGDAGADQLYGRGGNDTLQGGAGADGFYFDTALSGVANVDRISDFKAADDTIMLSRSVFSGLGSGALSASAFVSGAVAQDANDRILYDAAAGKIFYDADGSGAGAAVLFATVSANTVLTAADFMVYG